MTSNMTPFSHTYSSSLPALLWELQCTLAISTYQAGKVILLTATSPQNLLQHLYPLNRPMGMAVDGKRLAVATREEVVVIENVQELAERYLRHNDGEFLVSPQTRYVSGEVNLHDLAWGKDGLWAVNTLFSCLDLVDESLIFQSRWQPPFISELLPEDRCHLNGMAMVDGQPQYVTALGETNTHQGWRDNKVAGGVLMEIPGGQKILRGLPMPHSPRVIEGKLYLLFSATGELAQVAPEGGNYWMVTRLPGFARGMAYYKDYLFIGLSRLRQTSVNFKDLPIAQQSVFSGVVVVRLRDGQIVGHLKYETDCEEIYDVQVLPGLRHPGLIL